MLAIIPELFFACKTFSCMAGQGLNPPLGLDGGILELFDLKKNSSSVCVGLCNRDAFEGNQQPGSTGRFGRLVPLEDLF